MNTNVQILSKEIETFNNGNTTRCIIRATIDISSSLIALASSLPGWKKFINDQTNIGHIYVEKLGPEGTHSIVLTSMAYAYKHKNDAMNSKLGEHIATTKTQINIFRLARNFQTNLKMFIHRNICGELSTGIVGCNKARANCEKHLNTDLMKRCL